MAKEWNVETMDVTPDPWGEGVRERRPRNYVNLNAKDFIFVGVALLATATVALVIGFTANGRVVEELRVRTTPAGDDLGECGDVRGRECVTFQLSEGAAFNICEGHVLTQPLMCLTIGNTVTQVRSIIWREFLLQHESMQCAYHSVTVPRSVRNDTA